MERNTQQRQAILKVFEKTSRPLSIQEVHDLAKRRCRGIGIATVYRNLKALVADEKLLWHAPFAGAPVVSAGS